jgi:excisionase family DNA binding protein
MRGLSLSNPKEGTACPPAPGEWLTVEDVAAILGLKPGTIRSWISSGRLSAKKFGRAVRVHRSELERFVADAPRVGSYLGPP